MFSFFKKAALISLDSLSFFTSLARHGLANPNKWTVITVLPIISPVIIFFLWVVDVPPQLQYLSNFIVLSLYNIPIICFAAITYSLIGLASAIRQDEKPGKKLVYFNNKTNKIKKSFKDWLSSLNHHEHIYIDENPISKTIMFKNINKFNQTVKINIETVQVVDNYDLFIENRNNEINQWLPLAVMSIIDDGNYQPSDVCSFIKEQFARIGVNLLIDPVVTVKTEANGCSSVIKITEYMNSGDDLKNHDFNIAGVNSGQAPANTKNRTISIKSP